MNDPNSVAATAATVASEAAKIMEDLRTLLEKGGEFVASQAPPLAQEIISFGRVWHPMMALLPILIYAVIMWKWIPRIRRGWEHYEDEFSVIAGPLFGVIGGLASLVSLMANLEPAIKAWVAPRLYLLDYVKSLL
jgi:hypothetical protein